MFLISLPSDQINLLSERLTNSLMGLRVDTKLRLNAGVEESITESSLDASPYSLRILLDNTQLGHPAQNIRIPGLPTDGLSIVADSITVRVIVRP